MKENEYRVNTGYKQEDIVAEYLKSHEIYVGRIEDKVVAVEY